MTTDVPPAVLLDGVDWAESGHRRYAEDDVLWVQVLRCLRETGMAERRQLLSAHRARSTDRSPNVRPPSD